MKQLPVEYFQFEQDFMEDNIRCIPMIVRFKLDACGIKLKLKEWSKMTLEEREQLAVLPTETPYHLHFYAHYLESLVLTHTGQEATKLSSEKTSSAWSVTDRVPPELQARLAEEKMQLTLDQWNSLSVLQRFALIKLSRPGHENKNFPRAMMEFGIPFDPVTGKSL
jgi:hypothetical protein